MSSQPIYSTGDVAKEIGVNPKSVERWCRSGAIEAQKIGKHWAISHQSLETFRKENAGRDFSSKKPMTVYRKSFTVNPAARKRAKLTSSRKEEVHARADVMVAARRSFLRQKFPHPRPGEIEQYVLDYMAPKGRVEFDPTEYE